MSSAKLSDLKIKALKPKEKVYRILDADRLYIEVRPSGAKVWRFKFVFNGKESSMSLGEYPAITLADARILKDEMRAKFEPYRVCRRVNILRDYPDDKTKLYPRN